MDLSKLTDQDLAALQAGDLSKVSDAGLSLLQGTPTTASTSEKLIQSAGLSPKTQRLLQLSDAQTKTPQGVQELGAGLLPGLMGRIPGAANAGLLRKLGMEGAQAGTTAVAFTDPDQSPQEKLKTFLTGGLVGAGVRGLGELAGAGLGLAKKWGQKMARMSPAQGEAYIGDPVKVEKMASQLGNVSENPAGMVELQDQAINAINNSRRALKQQGMSDAKKLSGLFDGKSIEVSPQSLQGHHPEVDRYLTNNTRLDPAVRGAPGFSATDRITIPANDANNLKRLLQEASDFQPGTVIDPIQKAKQGATAKEAAGLRAALEGLDPGVAPLNKSMQEGALLQKELRKGVKTNPLAFASTEAPDRVATLARAERRGAGGLFDFGNEFGAAKSIAAKDSGSGVMSSPVRAAGRALQRGTSAIEPVNEAISDNPFIKQLIYQSLFK